MSEVNHARIYQFLSTYSSNGKSWIQEADNNGDNIIIKAEFREFMNDNWQAWNGNENGDLNNDIINEFWKKLDTKTNSQVIGGNGIENLNALDNDEIKNLEAKLEAYVTLDKFIKDHVKNPGFQHKYKEYLNDITAELGVVVEDCTNNNRLDTLETELAARFAEIESSTTAKWCAEEAKILLKTHRSIHTHYPDYNIGADPELDRIVEEYLANTDFSGLNFNEIMSDLKDIIREYLNGIFGKNCTVIGEDGSNGLTYAQNIYLTTNFVKLINGHNAFAGYENELQTMISEFLENKAKSYDYAYLRDNIQIFINEFSTSNEFKTLQTYIQLNKNYGKLSSQSDVGVYRNLKEILGDTLAKIVTDNAAYVEAYKQILKQIAADIASGKLANNQTDIVKAITEAIIANLKDFLPKNLKDVAVADLNKMYETLEANAAKESDVDKSLQMHKDAAIAYCIALTNKGENYRNVVKQVLGDDFQTTINNMTTPYDVKAAIEEIQALINEEVSNDSSSYNATINYNTQAFNKNFETNKTYSGTQYKFSATVTDANGETVSPDKYTYAIDNLKTSGCVVTIDAMGNLSIKTGNENEYLAFDVVIKGVDGKVIATKSILINVVKESNGAMKDYDPSDIGLNDTESSGKASKNSAVAGTKAALLSDAQANAKAKIRAICETITNKMIALGYSPEICEYAKTQVIDLYETAINGIKYNFGDDSKKTLDSDNEINVYTDASNTEQWKNPASIDACMILQIDDTLGCGSGDGQSMEIIFNTSKVLELYKEKYNERYEELN